MLVQPCVCLNLLEVQGYIIFFDISVDKKSYFSFNIFCFAEQQFSQVEKHLVSCNIKLDAESKLSENYKKELEQTGKHISTIIHNLLN